MNSSSNHSEKTRYLHKIFALLLLGIAIYRRKRRVSTTTAHVKDRVTSRVMSTQSSFAHDREGGREEPFAGGVRSVSTGVEQ